MKKILMTMLALVSAFAINFNTATKAELMKIKGIGPKKAEAIIKYRKTHKINSIDDLKNIKGINKKTILRLKKQTLKSDRLKKKIANKRAKIKNERAKIKKERAKIKAKKSKLNAGKSKMKAKIKAKREKIKSQKSRLNKKKEQLKNLKNKKLSF